MNRITWPLTIGSYVVSALPVFWLGYIVIYFFTHKLGLFPMAFGYATAARSGSMRCSRSSCSASGTARSAR